MTSLLERPVLASMMAVTLLLLGGVALFHLPIELAPGDQYPQLIISAHWSEAPPRAIQERLTAFLEGAAQCVRGVRRLESTSRAGHARVIVELEGVCLDAAEVAIRERLRRLPVSWPSSARPPEIQRWTPEEFPRQPFLRVLLSGSGKAADLRRLAEDRLLGRLREISGIQRVVVSGGGGMELRVLLDEARLQAAGSRLAEVSGAILSAGWSPGEAELRQSGRRLSIRLPREAATLEDIGDLIIRPDRQPASRVGELGEVQRVLSDGGDVARFNGQEMISIELVKEPGESAMGLATRVKNVLASALAGFPAGCRLEYLEDEGEEIKRRLRHVGWLSGLVGASLFVTTLGFTRNVRLAGLALLTVMLSLSAAVVVVFLRGLTLNLLTLSALALSCGLLVDNAVIALSGITAQQPTSRSLRRSIANGIRGVFPAALGGTLTTLAVFVLFPFFQGRLRVYYLPVAEVVGVSLVCSLVVSFGLLPALAKPLLGRTDRRAELPIPCWFRSAVHTLCRYPLIVFGGVVGLLLAVGCLFLDRVQIGGFFNWRVHEELFVRVDMPDGSSLSQTDEVVRGFEAAAAEESGSVRVLSRYSRHGALVQVSFPAEKTLRDLPKRMTDRFLAEASRLSGLSVLVAGVDGRYFATLHRGQGHMLNSGVTVRGPDLTRLLELAESIAVEARAHPRVRETQIGTGRRFAMASPPAIVLSPDREALLRWNVSWAEVVRGVAQRLPPPKGQGHIRLDGIEHELVVGLAGENRSLELGHLLDLCLDLSGERSFRLGELSRLATVVDPAAIERVDQSFVVRVNWTYAGPRMDAEAYQAAVKTRVKLPAGFRIDSDRPDQLTGQEWGQLGWALALTLLVIGMIMAALFESLGRAVLILASWPLGLGGVALAFALTRTPFDSSAVVGTLLASGVAVNAAILLVHRIDTGLARSEDRLTALVNAVWERVPPLLVTSITTVAGVLPFVLRFSGDTNGDIWSSLALATLGGVVAATLAMSVVLPPACYWWSTRAPRPAMSGMCPHPESD